jgi:hypothetical protein
VTYFFGVYLQAKLAMLFGRLRPREPGGHAGGMAQAGGMRYECNQFEIRASNSLDRPGRVVAPGKVTCQVKEKETNGQASTIGRFSRRTAG